MLTCDAFGVLPPIARLTPAQAMYHFLSGFTSKVAGTERGVTEPQPTFSTCFGAPFMPRRPEVYGALLRDRIAAGRRLLLAGQHRLDRRRLRHRPADADRRDPGAADRGARRLARRAALPHRPESSASRCRSRSPGVDAALLDPRTPGPTRPPTTRRPRGSWRCSPRTSPSTRRTSPTRSGRLRDRRLTDRGAADRARRPCPGAFRARPATIRFRPSRLGAVERRVGARQRLRQRRRPSPAPAPAARRSPSPPAPAPPPIVTGARATASRSRSAIDRRLAPGDVGEDREELLAADAPEQVAAAAARRHAAGHLLQHPVARGMAVRRR